MYTVSILNQKSGQWRSTTETTIAACVCLTMGLVTEWIVTQQNVGMTASDIVKGTGGDVYPKTTARYRHSLRSLLSRWVSSLASKTVLPSDDRNQLRHIMRLSDSAFLAKMRAFEGYIEQFNNNPVV